MPEHDGVQRAAGVPRRGLAVGCGGTLGFAWTAVTLRALERELGWDARRADVLLGTSAGSEMVALLASGRSADEIVAALRGATDDPVLAEHLSRAPGMLPPMPGPSWPARGLATRALRREVDLTAGMAGLLPAGRGDAAWLRDLGVRIAGDGWLSHPAAWVVAAEASTGARVAFGSPRAPDSGLADALAASWAIPGWFPPATVAGQRYVDGGTISSVSADLLAPLELDEVVVLAPMTSRHPTPATGFSRLERLLRRRMTRGLDREVALLRAAGTRVIRIEPSLEDLHAMGPNFMDLRRRAAVLETADRNATDLVRTALTAGGRA